MKACYLVFACMLFFNSSLLAQKMTPFIPEENPLGVGVIVCPGGSYFWLDKETEGIEVAQWLCRNGVAAFVLEYSHGGWAAFAFHLRIRGRSFPSGFLDLSNALDTVYAHAGDYGIRRDRIGCMGFSAGGHLVMHAAEQLAGNESSISFVAPIYPVVSMTHGCTHMRSRRGLLGERPSSDWLDSLSVEHHVPANCPPVFLVNCDDDPVVHHHNAELLDSALTAHNIPHRYEHFRTGGHGFGVSELKTSEEAIQWKDRFLEWLNDLFN